MKKIKNWLDKNRKTINIYIIFVLIFIIFLISFVIFPEITFNKIEKASNNMQIFVSNIRYNKNKLDKKIINIFTNNESKNLNKEETKIINRVRNNKETNNKTLEEINTNINTEINTDIIKGKETIKKFTFNKNDFKEYFIKETILLNNTIEDNIDKINDNSIIINDNSKVYKNALYIVNSEITLNDNNEKGIKVEYLYKNIDYPEDIIHSTNNFSLKINNDTIIKPSEETNIEIKNNSQTDIITLFFAIENNISYEDLSLEDIKLIYEDIYNYREIYLFKE